MSSTDLESVAQGIKKLEEEEAREVSLCLLQLLLSFQIRLEMLKENPIREEAKTLAKDFTDFLTQLRDALLGAD